MFTFRKATTPEEIRLCLELRRTVFIDEQGISTDAEMDGKDDQCYHFIGMINNEPIATGRILPKGDSAKVQRVAVIKERRGTGVGRTLMGAIIQFAKEDGFGQMVLSAQKDAIPFYTRLGFQPFGELYTDVGIQHQKMRLTL